MAATKDALSLATPIAEPVKVSDIHVRPNWNARTTFNAKDIQALADSMRTTGQLHPVILTAREEGGWWLNAGEMRLRAAGVAKMTHLRAAEVPEALAKLAMGHENGGRVQLSAADRVRYIVAQREAGTDVRDLAELLRLSPGSVRNDFLVGTKLDPAIFAEWAKHPNAGNIALRLYAHPPEVQRKMWAEWVKEQNEKAASGRKRAKRKGKKTDPGETRRPLSEVRNAITEMGAAVKASKGNTGKDALDKETAAFVAGAEWALAFLMNEKGVPRDVLAEVNRAAKAAQPDPRQLALPVGGAAKGKPAKR